jgi:hypothetical protein
VRKRKQEKTHPNIKVPSSHIPPLPPSDGAGFFRGVFDLLLGVRRVAACEVDFVEERVGPVFAAVGFSAEVTFEPAVAAWFESVACRGIDGLGGGEGEEGEERFEGDHFWS